MTRAQTCSRARKEHQPNAQPPNDALESQLRWLDQVVSLQTSWLTSCLALQADLWRTWSTGSQELPAWMVWHNGTEQLG